MSEIDERAFARLADQGNAAVAKQNRRIVELEAALRGMLDEYDGVYDMREPPRQSDAAKAACEAAHKALG